MIKCVCGGKGCTSAVRIDRIGTLAVDLVVSWMEDGKEHEARVALDANSLVQLILEAKRTLSGLGDGL